MEANVQNQNEAGREGGESAASAAAPELSQDQLEEHIQAELEKVVGIDQDVLTRYVASLETLPHREAAALVNNLKRNLGEQVLPLLEILAHHPHKPLAEIGIEHLGTVQSIKAAHLLSDINETHPDKKLRKIARKSLYKLKSVGIEVETTPKPLLREVKHQPYKALISAVDVTGSQLIVLAEEMLAGDLHFLQVVANDEEGITDCTSRRGMTKKMFAKFPETLAREMQAMDPMLVEADYHYALSLLLEAERLNDEAGADPPDDYLAVKDFFGLTDEAQPVVNPIYTLLDAETLEQQPQFLRTSKDLLQQQVFLNWLLPVADMEEYAQEILDQEDSVLDLPPHLQEERKEEVLRKVIEAHCGDEMLNRLQKRLEMMAYILHTKENENDAKRALAAAMALEDRSEFALRRHPFLHQLVLDSVNAAQYVIEDGYDPNELDREDYVVERDEEGEIIVRLFSA
jgi:hypothetical protein